MDEVGAVNNVSQNNVEKIKKKKHKKDRKSEKSDEGVKEAHNVDAKKEKKKKKKKKNKGVEDAENDSAESMVDAERKRKKREKKKNKNKNEKIEMNEVEEVKGDGSVNGPDGGGVSDEAMKEKKKKKKQKMKNNDIGEGEKDGEVPIADSEKCVVDATEVRKKKKKDKKKSKNAVDSSSTEQENVEDHANSIQLDGNAESNHERKKKKHKKKESDKEGLTAAEQEKAKKKKKNKVSKIGSNDDEAENANKGKKRKSSLVVNGPDGSPPTKSNKKVRFSDQDEVFTVPSNPNTDPGNDEEGNLVIGKRFTREEDEIVKAAVLKFIEENDLGEEGLSMVLSSQKHPKLKGCWREIASAIPYRPFRAIYYRARILFMRSETRKWTQEEYEIVRKYQEKHGNQWRALADELGKHTWHVKDTWRRIKLPNMKKGRWSQDEYQKLFNLVNTDLQIRVSEEKKSKHGMLRDNIAWSAISDTLSSRNQATCCLKWYNQMTSPMVAEGVWADTDDYRLISSLYSLDATCLEDVEWGELIEHRSGDLCRKRWGQMVKHIGDYGKQSFADQVEVLAQRYCPHLLEVREEWDSKPVVN